MRRILASHLLVVAAIAATSSPSAQAEVPDAALERECVAVGTSIPSWLRTVVYNRHPQSKTESLISAEVAGTARHLPKPCEARYRRYGYIKVAFRSSTSGRRWLAVRNAWESLDLDYLGPDDKDNHYSIGAFLYRGYLKWKKDLGCALQARVSLKLELQETGTGRVVAARFARQAAQVDTWRTFRCLGRLSIRDATRRCRDSVLGVAGTTPHRWKVSVRAVPCGRAAQIARAALRGHSGEARLDRRRVRGWQCVYSHNSAAACMRGAARVYLRTNTEVGEHCDGPGQVSDLIASNASCSVAAELARRAATRHRSAPVRYRAGGASWLCFGFRTSLVIAHHCYARNALITFETPDPALADPAPTTIAADVIYPGNGMPALGRKPLLHFGLDWGIESGQVIHEVAAEEGLVGRPAQLKVELWRWQCTSRDSSSCREGRRVGDPVVRQIILEQKFNVILGPLKKQGRWSYEVTLSTPGFTADNVRYQPATARLTFLML